MRARSAERNSFTRRPVPVPKARRTRRFAVRADEAVEGTGEVGFRQEIGSAAVANALRCFQSMGGAARPPSRIRRCAAPPINLYPGGLPNR